ncbi:hypothetical protein QWZ10_02850 [Paracoccus cavernae]|uniref:Uncharacterized protein n=1 Tax=Paracoccus cavernae TaxID=1571207 RepID=A0ABT8D2Z9_9RHOB|nr:hypothetical protein [Paracoccus cavernae]
MGFENGVAPFGQKARLLTRQLAATWLKWCGSAEKSSKLLLQGRDCFVHLRKM